MASFPVRHYDNDFSRALGLVGFVIEPSLKGSFRAVASPHLSSKGAKSLFNSVFHLCYRLEPVEANGLFLCCFSCDGRWKAVRREAIDWQAVEALKG